MLLDTLIIKFQREHFKVLFRLYVKTYMFAIFCQLLYPCLYMYEHCLQNDNASGVVYMLIADLCQFACLLMPLNT